MLSARAPRFILAAALLIAAALLAMEASADFEAGQQAFTTGDFSTAIAEWRAVAAKGHGRALFQLGQMYEQGLGVPKDPYTAFVLYRVAFQQGHAPGEDAANRAAGALAGGDLARGVTESERLKREKRYLPALPGAPAAAVAISAKETKRRAAPAPSPAPSLQAAAATAAPPAPARPVGERLFDLQYTCTMQLRYEDRGSGGVRDLALFDPVPAPGYVVLGGYAQGNYDQAHGCALSLKPAGGAANLLAAPQRWERVWKDKGTGSRIDGSIWRAMPPSEDFVCLGHVGQTGYETPSVPHYRCVHRCLVRSMPPAHALWTTEGTGAESKIAVYTLPHSNSFIATPKNQPPGEIPFLDPNGQCR